jgi:hypothetical protein
MDMSQPPLCKVPDLTGLSGKVSVRLVGRRARLRRFLAICLLAAAVGGPASLTGWAYQETSPFAKVQNAWLTASVSTVDTTPAAPTITFAQPPNVTVGTPVALSASVSPPGLPVLFSSDTTPVCTVTGATVTTLAVGTCTITAYQDGDPPRAASPVMRSFQVDPVKAGPAAQTITFAQPPDVRVSVPVTLSASASSGLPVSFSSDTMSVCTVADATVTTVAVGTCTITASQGGGARYLSAPDVSRSFQVNPAEAGPGAAPATTSPPVTHSGPADSPAPATGSPSAAPIKLASGPMSKQLTAVLAAVATAAIAGALTLALRGRRQRSRLPRQVTPTSDVRAMADTHRPGVVNVRDTGREPTHTVRFEPDHGTTTTTIKEKS